MPKEATITKHYGAFYGLRAPAEMWEALGAKVPRYGNVDTADADFGPYHKDWERAGYVVELIERAKAVRVPFGNGTVPAYTDDEAILQQAIVFFAADRTARAQQDLALALCQACAQFTEAMKAGTHMEIEGLDGLVAAIRNLNK